MDSGNDATKFIFYFITFWCFCQAKTPNSIRFFAKKASLNKWQNIPENTFVRSFQTACFLHFSCQYQQQSIRFELTNRQKNATIKRDLPLQKNKPRPIFT
ncbi:MAG: hypothetical protein E7616_00060 [Ruminococcaceae bacterium]|nr:hypothetical protein [Oscillospiraceae bacterium]